MKKEKNEYINHAMVNDENQIPQAVDVISTSNTSSLNTRSNQSTDTTSNTRSNQSTEATLNTRLYQSTDPTLNTRLYQSTDSTFNSGTTQNDQLGHPAQQEFVNQLIDRKDQVEGFVLQINRLWILFVKNIQLRRRKKFITLVELILPIVIFIFGLHQVNKMNPIDKETGNNMEKNFLLSLDSYRSLKNTSSPAYPYSKIYYDFKNESIDAKKLEAFLNDALERQVKLERAPKNISDEKYLLANFTVFDKNSIDYKLYSVENAYMYINYFQEEPRVITRLPVDLFHESILRELASKLNDETKKYSIDFEPLDLKESKPDNPDQTIKKYKNENVFIYYQNLFFVAFFVNGVFVIRSICAEKKTRSFEFLKLMGATDEEILFGHFMNHFLIWLVPFAVCITYFWNFVPKALMPTNIPLIFLFFSLLFFAHLLSFIFMLTSPFEKYIYAELMYVISAFACNFSIAYGLPKGFYGFLVIGHPLIALQKLMDIFKKELIFEFDFKENFFTIITYSGSEMTSILSLVLIVIFFILIELGLTNYIIQVNPFQKGITKPFYYLLMPSNWIKHKPVTEYTQPDKKEFEKVAAYRKPAIILKNIHKSFRSWLTFNKFQVLKDFSFAIYEKQITVLLGHNGAGKTTTMDLIAGLSCADSGTISVKGIPVSPYTSYFKKALGYCPQENIFYEDLSVYQNLKLAAYLKGCSSASVDKKIKDLSKIFDLQFKLNEIAKNLSGGMKRRLVVAIAIIGYNDVLVIDEPTSGLDPENRRKVWEILLELRKRKTILLTTHFLEEADILGDSIAIMYDGQIKCSGSTLFLKKLYNVGYLLRLELNKEVQENDLVDLIKKYVPNASYQDRQTSEYFIRLIPDESEKEENLNLRIAKLFDAFENQEIKDQYGIQTYSLTNTSLEDVFIKIGTLEHPKDEDAIEIEDAEDHPLYNLNRIKGFNLYTQQFVAIFIKKLKLLIKNLQTFVSSLYPLLLPTLTVLLYGLIVTKLFPLLLDMNRTKINSFDLNKNLGSKEILLINNSFNPTTDLFREENHKYLKDKFGLYFKSYDSSNYSNVVSEEKKRLGFDDYKNSVLLTSQRVDDYHYKFHINPSRNPVKFFPTSLVGTLNSFYSAIANEKEKDSDFNVNLKFELETLEEKGRSEATKIFFTLAPYLGLKPIFDFLAIFCLAIVFSHPFSPFIDVLNDELSSGALDMQIIAGLSKTLYWISNFLFDFFYFFLIMAISCISFYFLDYFTLFTNYIGEIFLIFVFTIFNCLLITYFVINLRLSKQASDIIVKYSIMISCLAIGFLDIVYYSMNGWKIEISEEGLPQISPNKEKISLPFSFGFMVLSPPYNVLDQFSYFIIQYFIKYCFENEEKTECTYLDKRNYDIKYNILASIICSIIFIFLIFLSNYYSHQVQKISEWAATKFWLFKSKKEIEQLQAVVPKREVNENILSHNVEDPNIEKERQLVQMLIETNNLQSNILVVHDLKKMFGDFEAVSHLSFTVKKQECFGLLGINGAGKTTTFKVIGGSHVATSGKVILDKYTYEKNPYEYYRRLAYCPQENTHTKRITVEDNLRFYARINGLPNNLIEKAVKTLIEECDLKDHKYKFTEKLSGGNKRKLSTAISLIGKKDLVLLDEPTTGVDPLARRKLWKTINFYKKKLETSFILTSHSMDEVEQLCSRISIMAAGKFKALGTFSYLKDRYSQGFTILIKIKEANNKDKEIEKLKERMREDFKEKATMKEFYMNTMVYIILSKTFKWSHLFRMMEKIKIDHDLDDFSVSETNLEQIFLSFTDK